VLNSVTAKYVKNKRSLVYKIITGCLSIFTAVFNGEVLFGLFEGSHIEVFRDSFLNLLNSKSTSMMILGSSFSVLMITSYLVLIGLMANYIRKQKTIFQLNSTIQKIALIK